MAGSRLENHRLRWTRTEFATPHGRQVEIAYCGSQLPGSSVNNTPTLRRSPTGILAPNTPDGRLMPRLHQHLFSNLVCHVNLPRPHLCARYYEDVLVDIQATQRMLYPVLVDLRHLSKDGWQPHTHSISTWTTGSSDGLQVPARKCVLSTLSRLSAPT